MKKRTKKLLVALAVTGLLGGAVATVVHKPLKAQEVVQARDSGWNGT